MNKSKGQQLYIYNKHNALLNAACAAAVRASGLRPLIYPVAKQGTGNIAITGDFEGAEDAVYDVKVLDTAFEDPHVSAPVFKGAGTGKISNIEVSGIAAQKITIMCKSIGIDTESAVVEVGGLLYRAKAGGAAGNAIYITVDDSELTFTPTNYSLIKGLKQGDTALEGAEWDFDTKPMSNDLVPADAHRIAFGGNTLDVYLQYKKWADTEWQYYFLPVIRRDVPAGARAYFVTGGRTITITLGSAPAVWNDLQAYALDALTVPVTGNNRRYRCTNDGTSDTVEPTWPTTIGDTVIDGTVEWTCEAYIEEYTDIVTMADFWHEAKDNSTLIEPVASSIDASRKVTSPEVQEFAVKTSAYAFPPYAKEGSSKYAGKLDSVFVTASAKTELIEIECVNNEFVGAEIWDVRGGATGDIGSAQSGIPAIFGHVGFTVPQARPPDWDPVTDTWSHKWEPAVREEGVSIPALCFDMKLGVASIPQTLTLEYKQKPADCNCPAVKFSDTCLGLTPYGEGGETGMAYTVPDLVFWLQTLKERMREAYSTYEYIEPTLPPQVVDYFERFETLARRIMALTEDNTEALGAMVTDLKSLAKSMQFTRTELEDLDSWSAFTGYTTGQTVQPTTPNNLFYRASLVGKSGATEPTWPTDLNWGPRDGTLKWRKQGNDYGQLAQTWQANHAYSFGQNYIRPTTPNGYLYMNTYGDDLQSGATEPTWPIVLDETVLDGDVTWTCVGFKNSISICWIDVTSEWSGIENIALTKDVQYDMAAYSALVDDVLEYERTYGIKKNSIAPAGTCYQEDADAGYYWEVKGSKSYLPAYTDLNYYSTVLQDGGIIIATKEFAFLISFPCGGSPLEGDIIRVNIAGQPKEVTYQIGDVTYLPTIAAQDLYLRGGVDGDDTYIFSCLGEIDSFPDYSLDRNAPAPYAETGLGFLITDGIVGFSVGDLFEFNVEGGHFVWRKDGGAWSDPALDIDATAQTLDEGLSIAFVFGTSPSFVVDDQWEVICRQSGKFTNMLNLQKNLIFSGVDTVPFDMTEEIDADCIVIDGHNLTVPFTLQASTTADFGTLEYEKEITPTPLICHLFTETVDEVEVPLTVSARYWRLVIVGDVDISYCFIGMTMQISLSSDVAKPRRKYTIDRQEKKEPFSLFSYKQKGYAIEYSSFVFHNDFLLLEAMIDYVKTNNDDPVYFIPNFNYPADCLRARIDTDNIEFGSDLDMNAPEANRLYTLSLPLIGHE